MPIEKTIEPHLFDLLDEVACLLSNSSLDEEDEDDEDLRIQKEILRIHKIENRLEDFIENFLLQFFRNSYGLNIDGVNYSSLTKIKRHFRLRFWSSPKEMVKIFEKAIEVKEDIAVAVYLSPPREKDLVDAYNKFTREMLNAFKKEGREIENYNNVVIRINRTLELMSEEEDPTKQTKLV